jgi:hypothetical protein
MITDYGKIFTEEEISAISSLIKSNKHYWTHCSYYSGKDCVHFPKYYLGSPSYPLDEMEHLIDNAPNRYIKFEEKSINFFKENIWITERILNKVTEIFQLPTEKYGSFPGFHIMNSKKRNNTFVNIYHTDLFDVFYYSLKNLKEHNITNELYSMTVCIESPSSGAGLYYKEDDIEKYYPYSENGRLLIWKGSLPHRAAPINLITDDEYRITYQGHFLLKPDKILYFW